ncbi:phosphate ABC transporter permease PstA [Merismopedia glauca]|uniref:Phosphate transport system permease protein PstA n=1 Tax=Merismopedia glauca CCAP 1448/3 TaxID=1296344 RepID=A0A2T1C6I5_9CYAN|nr:phosphate ABC transporter permease PstA [Merismopedia glauca]PSB03871.1 phosphate ABC transporter permease PtsA [Merismopedia glauca CCAP 1448/3]
MTRTNHLPTLTIWSVVFLVATLSIWIIGDVAIHGWGKISWEFLISEPQNAGRNGGIAPIIVSTALILLVSLAVSLPVSIGTAVLLAEFTPIDNWFAKQVRLSLDILSGVPSIVFGLFGNALFVRQLGLGFSILSGGLTLACMILPLLIRSIEVGLRAVPDDYRKGAACLGLSRTSTLWHLLLPAALPGLMVGLILGIGRAIAETAALIFTSGYVDRFPESVLDSGRTLAVHIFDLSMNVSGGESQAYGTACVLILFLLIINQTAAIANQWLSKTITRQ